MPEFFVLGFKMCKCGIKKEIQEDQTWFECPNCGFFEFIR